MIFLQAALWAPLVSVAITVGLASTVDPAALPAQQSPPQKRASPGDTQYLNRAFGYRLTIPNNARLDDSNRAQVIVSIERDLGGAAVNGTSVLAVRVIAHPNPSKQSAQVWGKAAAGELGRVQSTRTSRLGSLDAYEVVTSEIDAVVVREFVSHASYMFELVFTDSESLAELPEATRTEIGQTIRRIVNSFAPI
jgi:hypothetical protein